MSLRHALVLCAALLATACAAVRGDGVAREDALALVDDDGEPIASVPAIGGASVQHGLRVEIEVGPAPAAPRLTIDANLFERVIGRLDDELYLDLRTSEPLDPQVAPVVTFATPALDYVSARGEGASARVQGVTGLRFRLAASEGADVTVSGSCEELTIIASGGGTVDARGLECARGFIDSQGGTTVRAHFTDAVVVTASGESAITVSGSPTDVDERLTDDSTLVLE